MKQTELETNGARAPLVMQLPKPPAGGAEGSQSTPHIDGRPVAPDTPDTVTHTADGASEIG